MTLQECYAAMGGDYEEALGRLRSERLIRKFVLKFLDDPSYNLLCTSLDEKNYSEAFRAAHTIKGVCQNLSITPLGESGSKLTEALRNGHTPEVDALFDQVTADYRRTVDAIRVLQSESDG